MTILICIPCLMTGGTEIQTLNLVQALVAGGHRVVTTCYFEYSDDMVVRFRKAGSEVVCLSPTGTRVNGWRGILFLYKGLRRVLKQYKPDVAHVQYMAPGAIPILLLRWLGIRQIIATAHTAADIYPNLRLVHFIQRHCVRAFTCITELAERSFFGTSRLYNENTPLSKRNHFTIYNALPPGFSIVRENRSFVRPITIGVVSRVQECDCTDNVEWAGRQPQERLMEWYRRMDIVLMPSRSEGFGLTAIEAMANGCVVVASRTGGLPEVVQDGVVGLLHKVGSIDDMANKIISLIATPELLQKYSSEAIRYVRRYSFERYSQLFNGLYKRII